MSSVRLFVLGIMQRERQAHGYKVYRDLIDWQADKWTSLKPGSIYHALGQLQKEGHLQAAGQQNSKEGPSREVYKITQTGKNEFLRLERAALQNSDLNIESFAAGLAFMSELPRDEVLALLKERHELLAQTAAFMGELPVEDQPTDPSRLPPLIGLWAGFFEQLANHSRTLIKDIESGKYTFA